MDISTFNSLFCEHGEQVPNSFTGTEKDMIMRNFKCFHWNKMWHIKDTFY